MDIILQFVPYCNLQRAAALSCIFLPSQINIFILCWKLIRGSYYNFYAVMQVATQYKMCINTRLISRAYHDWNNCKGICRQNANLKNLIRFLICSNLCSVSVFFFFFFFFPTLVLLYCWSFFFFCKHMKFRGLLRIQ